MVSFYQAPKKENPIKKAVKVVCSDLDLQGRGVARDDKYIYFVDGLMPGDEANVLATNTKGKIVTAKVTKLIKPSSNRVKADCKYQDKCGGCPLQFVPASDLISYKAKGVKKLFTKALGQIPECSFSLKQKTTGYRRACRFAIRGDHGKLNLGFRETGSQKLVKIDKCLTLTDRINQAILPVTKAINALSIKGDLGHVEFLDSDGKLGILVRVTKVLNQKDEQILIDCANNLDAVLSVVEPFRNVLEMKKTDTTKERFLVGSEKELYITSQGVKIECMPSSFVQVSRQINEEMIAKVIELLKPSAEQKILDLFCGLGNFTLPIAKTGAQIVGVDIVARMIEDARDNAKTLGLENARFEIADLEELFENQNWAKAQYDVAVMDPGRMGAKRASLFLIMQNIKRVILISCNPLAASRDCKEFIDAGYKIEQWGVADMFPRTTHLETIILMTKDE